MKKGEGTLKSAFKTTPLATAIGLAVAGQILPAIAEESSELQLEEIVITAQKKEEPLQDAPIAITALNSEALEQQGINDMTDLRGTAPSLSVAPFAATRAAPVVFIRGMGNIDIQSTRDGAVGTYLDGVSLGRASGLATEIADLERVEILRGPQGTLYGRNTTGGAINFITKKPATDGYHFKQQLTAGNYNLVKSVTSANLAFTDNFAASASYMMTEQDGWVENKSAGADQVDFNEDDSTAGRVALRFTPTDKLAFDYAYDFSELEYGNGFYQRVSIDPPGPANNYLDTETNFGWDVETDRKDEHSLFGGLQPSKSEVKGHNFTVTIELDSVTLKSITDYRELDDDLFQNYNDLFIQTNQQEQDQVSQEFQATGSAGERIEYVAGLYYFSEDAEEAQLTILPGMAYINLPVLADGVTPNPYFNPAPEAQFDPNAGDDLDAWAIDAESTSVAAYARVTWTPAIIDDKLHLTFGLRHTKDSREVSKTFVNNGANNYMANVWGYWGETANGTVLSGDKDFSKTNPALTIDFDVNDDIGIYAKVSTGYRAGGFGTRSTTAGFEQGFDEENVTSFEAGFKSHLADKRVRLNAAIFHNDYEDLQISQKRNPEIYTDIINAGEATIDGIEIELTALITQGLTLDFFYAWLDAEYDEYIDNNTDYSDEKEIPYAPENSTRIALNYELPVSYGTYGFNLNYYWQDTTYSAPFKEDVNDSYGILNSRIELADIGVAYGTLTFGLWGKNLTDEEYTTITTNFASSGFTSSMFGTPRTYGLDAIYQF